jgi:hypothetical protein
VNCPSCGRTLAASEVDDAAGWGKCSSCNEVFRLDKSSTGDPPFNARATVERRGEELVVSVPPEGMRANSWALLAFAVVWFSFFSMVCIVTWLVAFPDLGAPVMIATILAVLPFWIVGLGIVGCAFWTAKTSRVVRIDSARAEFVREGPLWRLRKTAERRQVRAADPCTASLPAANGVDNTRHGVCILLTADRWTLLLDDAGESAWLAKVVNDFLQTPAARSIRSEATAPAKTEAAGFPASSLDSPENSNDAKFAPFILRRAPDEVSLYIPRKGMSGKERSMRNFAFLWNLIFLVVGIVAASIWIQNPREWHGPLMVLAAVVFLSLGVPFRWIVLNSAYGEIVLHLTSEGATFHRRLFRWSSTTFAPLKSIRRVRIRPQLWELKTRNRPVIRASGSSNSNAPTHQF